MELKITLTLERKKKELKYIFPPFIIEVNLIIISYINSININFSCLYPGYYGKINYCYQINIFNVELNYYRKIIIIYICI
jgi:hypothetical protein